MSARRIKRWIMLRRFHVHFLKPACGRLIQDLVIVDVRLSCRKSSRPWRGLDRAPNTPYVNQFTLIEPFSTLSVPTAKTAQLGAHVAEGHRRAVVGLDRD